MRLYADQAAYEAYHGLEAGAAPADVDRRLRTASRLVDYLLRGVVYQVDPAGMPVDVDVAQAMSDATCAIAGAVPAADADAGTEWDSVSIGNVSLSGRKQADGGVTVGGVTIPPDALVSLADVGQVAVVVR